MAKNLEKYDKLVAAILVIVIFIFGVGWWFAEEKSEPVYRTKIDRLMFDKNNKAPKLILTLPDKLVAKSKQVDVVLDATPAPVVEPQEKEREFSLETLLAGVPNVFGLPAATPSLVNKYVDFAESLVTRTESGQTLPKISEDGHKPWIEYGSVVQIQPNFKKVALVISGIGLDVPTAKKIAEAFPSEVSFSLNPYSTKPLEPLSDARRTGHETYVDLPLASKDFLREDTGPLALDFNLPLEGAFERLFKILDKPAPFGGLIVQDGALYDLNSVVVQQMFSEIKKRGLLIVDAVSGDGLKKLKIDGLARRKADIIIHRDMSKEQIEAELKKAETIAFDKGQVLIVTDSKPFIIMEVYRWIQTFSPQISYEEAKTVDITKPFALVPVSNLVVE